MQARALGEYLMNVSNYCNLCYALGMYFLKHQFMFVSRHLAPLPMNLLLSSGHNTRLGTASRNILSGAFMLVCLRNQH